MCRTFQCNFPCYARAGPNSDTVEQTLERADLWSETNDCSVSWRAQGWSMQGADRCSKTHNAALPRSLS